MIPRDLRESVEGHDVAAQVNLASGLRHALRILRRLPQYVRLREWCEADGGRGDLLVRVLHLVARRSDLRYEHPDDVAVLAYMHALSRLDREVAKFAAYEVLDSGPNLWWARRFSDDLLRDNPLAATGSGTSEIAAGAVGATAGEGSGNRVLSASAALARTPVILSVIPGTQGEADSRSSPAPGDFGLLAEASHSGSLPRVA